MNLSSAAVAALIEAAVSRGFELRLEDALAELDRAGNECLENLDSEPLKTEVRRRVAEWRLRVSCDRSESWGNVYSEFGAVNALGFSNLENELAIKLYYANYCRNNGLNEEVVAVLSPVRKGVIAASETIGQDAASYFVEEIDRAMSKL